MAKKQSTTKKQPVPRPNFKPCWTEVEGLQVANEHLAPDHPSAVAFRIAAAILASTAEKLMRGGLAVAEQGGKSPAEVVCDILCEGEELLQSRIDLLRVAKGRVVWTASFANGAEWPAA